MLEHVAYVPLMFMLVPFINCKQRSPWCGARYSLGFLPFNLNSSWARGQLAAWVVNRDVSRDINRDCPDDVQTGPASVKL